MAQGHQTGAGGGGGSGALGLLVPGYLYRIRPEKADVPRGSRLQGHRMKRSSS
jgi:hypothetical protein